MEQYNCDGEKYYFKDGSWLTSNYTKAPLCMISKLNNIRFDSIPVDVKGMSYKQISKLIDTAKQNDNILLAYKYALKALEIATIPETSLLLPRITSLLRRQDKPGKAISMYKEYASKYGELIYSPMLFTSIAAAYCDIDDYDTAREFADRANALGKTDNQDKLIKVYQRINFRR